MSKVQARFIITSITRMPTIAGKSEVATIQLTAIKDDLFGPATPDGSIRMTIANESAALVFHQARMGEEFVVTFQSLKDALAAENRQQE